MMALLFWLLLSGVSHAASLAWDYDLSRGTVPATADVQRSASLLGPYTTVATIPSLPATWTLPVIEDSQYYRISNAGGVSNVVQYVAIPAPPGPVVVDTLTPRVLLLEQKVASLEVRLDAPVVTPPPPAPTSNLTVRQIDADHIEITCNGIGISTTGSGTRRFMECRH
jgi:hypothetical protein